MEHPEILRAVRALTRITNYAHSLGFAPFYCPKGTTKWILAPSRRRITIIKFLILYSHMGLVYYHTLKLWMTDGAPIMKKIHFLYTTVGFTIVAFNMNVVYQDPTIIPALMNNLLQMINKRFKSDTLTRNEIAAGASNLAVRISRMTQFICTFIPVTYSIAIFQKPENPRYLTSLLQEPRKVSMPVKLLVGFYHTYATAFVFSVLMITYAFTSTFSWMVASLIDSLRVTGSRELNKLSTQRFICMHGRACSVLLQYFNGVFGRYTLTMEILGITATVVNFTWGVTELSIRGFVIAALTMPITVLTYEDYGVVFDSTKEIVASWMTNARGGWFLKYCRSYRPLRINIGSFYHADRELALTILSIILNYTASLALAIREH